MVDICIHWYVYVYREGVVCTLIEQNRAQKQQHREVQDRGTGPGYRRMGEGGRENWRWNLTGCDMYIRTLSRAENIPQKQQHREARALPGIQGGNWKS